MATNSSDPLVGSIIGSFKIVKILGRGGMGTVYLGEHTVIGSKVAIKILLDRLAAEESLVARFYAEARAVNLIGHENIVNVFDMNMVPPRRYYLVMEYLEGKQLNALLTEPMQVSVALPILIQVCDALQAAHDAGVVHRDLKPENIFLIDRLKAKNFVKVLDFGLAKLLDNRRVNSTDTAAGLIVGTPEFMSPEQTNSEPVDGRSDIYSLGCIAWLMLVGRLPYAERGLADLLVAHRTVMPPEPMKLNRQIPPAVNDAVMVAIQKDPARRFQTAREFGAALQAAYEGSVTPRPLTLPLAKPSGNSTLIAAELSIAERNRSPEKRFASRFSAHITGLDGSDYGTLHCLDISRGGMFLSSIGPVPEIFSRVKITVSLPKNLGGSFVLLGEVVRYVPADQAEVWKMSAGFGVRFVELTPELRDRLATLIRGLPPATETPPPTMRDSQVERGLSKWRDLMNGDHYMVLGLTSDADISDVQERAIGAREELAILREGASDEQLAQIDASLARVELAVEQLTDPMSRARYDAQRGNFRGVAKCIVVGLGPLDIEGLRQEYLTNHPNSAGAAHGKFLAAKGFEAQGRHEEARDACEAALRLDPLNLQLHRHLAALRDEGELVIHNEI